MSLTREQRSQRKAEAAAHAAKMVRIYEANQRIVVKGVCPDCGGKLVRNLSLSGWWQCEQLGSVVFRKDPSKPSCGFQLFTK